jgi:two-component system sensor histidine kinase UhpB
MKYVERFIIVLCFQYLFSPLLARQSQTLLNIDSAKAAFEKAPNNTAKVQSAFYILDNYMELDRYDSSQIWLNKIAEIYMIKEASVFNYFIASRQAEVYYYNGLLQLGLESASKALQIAQSLKDSILLADAYNMTGLMYSTMGNFIEAKPYFYVALTYVKQPPFPEQYLSSTYPHHIYGNLAETCEKLKMMDSARVYSYLSLQKATEINARRGMAVAHNNLGNEYFEQRKIDSAVYHYQRSVVITQYSKDVDVELVNYAGLADCANALNQLKEADEWLIRGYNIIRNSPEVNALFTKMFLQRTLAIYQSGNNSKGLIATYATLVQLDSMQSLNNSLQLQNILKLSAANENKVLKMEVNEANHNQQLATTRFLIALLGILLLGISFIVYRNSVKNKLRVASIRNNISQDLHDDVGASLSSIHIYSSIAMKLIAAEPAKASAMLEQINSNTQQIMGNMNDIVWSLNTSKTVDTSFSSRIKNYGYELLSPKQIECEYNIDEHTDAKIINPHVRKNLLLIVKETMNNLAKYSEATRATFSIQQKGGMLELIVSDNGKGFHQNGIQKGNGLNNMQQRATLMNGTCTIDSKLKQGTTITCRFPLTTISDT